MLLWRSLTLPPPPSRDKDDHHRDQEYYPTSVNNNNNTNIHCEEESALNLASNYDRHDEMFEFTLAHALNVSKSDSPD